MYTIDQIARVYLAEEARFLLDDLDGLIAEVEDILSEEDKATLNTACDLLNVIHNEALSKKKEFFPADFQTCCDRLYTIGAELPYDTENLSSLDRIASIFYTIAHTGYTLAHARAS